MLDITDLIRHLEDERRTVIVYLKELYTEKPGYYYFYNQGKLTELNYIIKLLRGMLQ